MSLTSDVPSSKCSSTSGTPGSPGVLEAVAVAIREDRPDDAGVGREDAAGDEDARLRGVRPHVAAHRVRAIDAVALQRAGSDAHPIGDQSLRRFRPAPGSQTSGRARRPPPDPAAAAPRRRRPGVPNRRCSGSRAAAGRSPTRPAASGRRGCARARRTAPRRRFRRRACSRSSPRSAAHAAPGEPSSVQAHRRPAAAHPIRSRRSIRRGR